jgi:hypothetical protein
MPAPATIECACRFERRGQRGRLRVSSEVIPDPTPAPLGRVPRLTRLMALAFRFEGLIARGLVRDYAELARLGHVSRARLTQIMNLRLLCPQIQEEILFLPPTVRGRDPIRLELLQPIALEPDWHKQRRRWAALTRRLLPFEADSKRSRKNSLSLPASRGSSPHP